MNALIAEARKTYHKSLLENGILTVDSKGIPSNADKSSNLSVAIARGIAKQLFAQTQEKVVGQTSGARFEQVNMQFLLATFPQLQNLRPGSWHVVKVGNRSSISPSSFAQYEHLNYLNNLSHTDTKLAASIGNDYMISPDVVIYRDTVTDSEINTPQIVVDDTVCKMADIRTQNGGLPIFHASVSSKWTIRSDRAQNSRTEALGLIRNRKGRLPHIVVVAGEPMPGRLASLALGTGDIDCMYHFALYELIDAVRETGAEDSIEMLNVLIEGKRIKDISDLPLDLAI